MRKRHAKRTYEKNAGKGRDTGQERDGTCDEAEAAYFWKSRKIVLQISVIWGFDDRNRHRPGDPSDAEGRLWLSDRIQENLVTLGRELENTKNYFLIQKYRFGNRFSLEIRFEDAGCLEEYLIPKMTLQPIVENAIFHGLEKSVSEGVILVDVVETEQRLLLSVQDNGVGMSGETLKRVRESLSSGRQGEREGEHTGIALSNINERIRMHFGSRYSLSVNSEEGLGTEVLLTLPKIEKQKEAEKEGP